MTWEMRQGEVLDRLREMPAEAVNCVVTSPPYWGLRDYGTASWEGGEADCKHLPNNTHQRQGQTGECANRAFTGFSPFKAECGLCGARRTDDQLGLEATPEEYVERMVGVFREVRRVLRKDGTCWINLGDSYVSGSLHGAGPRGKSYTERSGSRATGFAYSDLCDGCAAAQANRSFGNDQPHSSASVPLSLTGRDSGRLDSGLGLQSDAAPSVPASTNHESSPQLLAECSHCSNCGACLSVLRSSSRDARQCGRRAEYMFQDIPEEDILGCFASPAEWGLPAGSAEKATAYLLKRRPHLADIMTASLS